MRFQTMKCDLLLLLTAAIWGGGFVAQRMGMENVGPFTFNGIRFALGSLSLLPILMRSRKHRVAVAEDLALHSSRKMLIFGGAVTGLALFMGATLQQIGLVYTTAGKAGFITGLYVVIVPLLGLCWGQRPELGTWSGAFLAAVGLYLLSVTEHFTIEFGDLLELVGAFFWAGHVVVIGWMSPRMDPIKLSFFQFAFCSVLSSTSAIIFEVISLQRVLQAAVPILYGGVISVGVAYTLQVVAQRDAHPAHAAILLSMEAVFAALGGWLILGEVLSPRGIVGCALMLAGMLFSQISAFLLHQKRTRVYQAQSVSAKRQSAV